MLRAQGVTIAGSSSLWALLNMARMAYRPYRHVSQVLYMLNSLSFRAACVAVRRDRLWPICARTGHLPGSARGNHMGDQGRRRGRAPRKATIAKRPCLISASRSLDVRGELSEARLKGSKAPPAPPNLCLSSLLHMPRCFHAEAIHDGVAQSDAVW